MNFPIPNIGPGGGTTPADDTAQAGAIALRDLNADLWAAIMRGIAGVRSGGHLYLKRSPQTANFTVNESTSAGGTNGTYYPADCSVNSANITATLMAAALTDGKVMVFKKIDSSAFTYTIDANGSEDIDEALTVTLTNQDDAVGIISDGAGLRVLFRYRAAAGVLYASQQDSSNITNLTAETVFDQNYTIPGNTLKAGDVLTINQSGLVTNQNSTDTLNVKSYLGTQLLGATGALDVSTNDIFDNEFQVVIRTIGASGSALVRGRTMIGTPGTTGAKLITPTAFTIDTTATQIVKATGTWSNANAANVVKQMSNTLRRDPVTV